MIATEDQLRAAAGDDPGANQIVRLWLDTKAQVEDAFRTLAWRDEAITEAVTRHPAAWDLIWHAAPWLHPAPGFTMPRTRFVWMGHMGELLDRAGQGTDLRPATWAEICLLMSAASERAPLRPEAVGLYIKAWVSAFGPDAGGMAMLGEELPHYERMEGVMMDVLEREARAAVARRNQARRFPPPGGLACTGLHDGEPAESCRFIPGTLDGQPAPAPARRARPAPSWREPAPARPGPGDDDLTLF